MSKICANCGRETNILIKGLCPKCYVKNYGIIQLPLRGEFEICKYCGSVRVGNKWIQVNSFQQAIETIIQYLIKKSIKQASHKEQIFTNISLARITYNTLPNWRTHITLDITAETHGYPVTETKNIIIQLKPTICPVCKIRVSGEYDTVLQIRGIYDPETLEEQIYLTILEQGLGKSFVDLIRTKDQINVYFSNKGAARKLAKRLIKMYGGSLSQLEYEDVTVSSQGKRRSRKTLTLYLKTQKNR